MPDDADARGSADVKRRIINEQRFRGSDTCYRQRGFEYPGFWFVNTYLRRADHTVQDVTQSESLEITSQSGSRVGQQVHGRLSPARGYERKHVRINLSE